MNTYNIQLSAEKMECLHDKTCLRRQIVKYQFPTLSVKITLGFLAVKYSVHSLLKITRSIIFSLEKMVCLPSKIFPGKVLVTDKICTQKYRLHAPIVTTSETMPELPAFSARKHRDH